LHVCVLQPPQPSPQIPLQLALLCKEDQLSNYALHSAAAATTVPAGAAAAAAAAADFINYYADVDTAKPVRWTFLWSSAEFHVLEFNEGDALPKKLWQAPKYCFSNASSVPTELDQQPLANGRMFRLQAAREVEAAAHAKRQRQQQQQQPGKAPAS
jgi:hypothetical protein